MEISISRFSWRRQWHPTPVLLPGKSHGRRSLVGCSPWDRKESDLTEQLHFHFSLSCIGEGNGNPLQCSCLKNPRGGGAWWAAIYGVAQSRTRLKRLSSSSSGSILAHSPKATAMVDVVDHTNKDQIADHWNAVCWIPYFNSVILQVVFFFFPLGCVPR